MKHVNQGPVTHFRPSIVNYFFEHDERSNWWAGDGQGDERNSHQFLAKARADTAVYLDTTLHNYVKVD